MEKKDSVWTSGEEIKNALCKTEESLRMAQQDGEKIERWVELFIDEMVNKGLLQKITYGGKTFYRTSNFLKSLFDAAMNHGGSA